MKEEVESHRRPKTTGKGGDWSSLTTVLHLKWGKPVRIGADQLSPTRHRCVKGSMQDGC